MKDRKTTKERFTIALDRTVALYDPIPINDALNMLDKIRKQITDTIFGNPSFYDWYFEPQVKNGYDGDKTIEFELRATRPLNNDEIAALKQWDENLEIEQRKQYEELKKKFGEK
jgi:hypothetical protein